MRNLLFLIAAALGALLPTMHQSSAVLPPG